MFCPIHHVPMTPYFEARPREGEEVPRLRYACPECPPDAEASPEDVA